MSAAWVNTPINTPLHARTFVSHANIKRLRLPLSPSSDSFPPNPFGNWLSGFTLIKTWPQKTASQSHQPHPEQNRWFTACATCRLLPAGQPSGILGEDPDFCSPQTSVLDHCISTNLSDHEGCCIQTHCSKNLSSLRDHRCGKRHDWCGNMRGWVDGRKKRKPPDHLLNSYNKKQISLLCPSDLQKGNFPLCLTQRNPSGPRRLLDTSASRSLRHTWHSATRTLTLGTNLWQPWWELSRDTWLIQPCSCHTPQPPFFSSSFISLCCIRSQQGRQEEAARRHVHTYHVSRTPACIAFPSPFTSTSYWVIYRQMNKCSAF